jgi:hypothetical protein
MGHGGNSFFVVLKWNANSLLLVGVCTCVFTFFGVRECKSVPWDSWSGTVPDEHIWLLVVVCDPSWREEKKSLDSLSSILHTAKPGGIPGSFAPERVAGRWPD